MDISQLEQALAQYEAQRDRKRLEEAVHRELTIAGGLGNAANNVAGLIQQAQNNSGGSAQWQANGQAQWAPGAYQGSAHLPNAAQAGQALGGTFSVPDEEGVTRGILHSFKLKDKSTYEFAEATAQLLSASIRAGYSPNRAPYISGRREWIVWQLFNHNWMVDVQWVGDATGGSEEEWTKHFAKLADRISEARESGAKQHGDEPSRTLHTSGYAQALAQFGASQQVCVNQQGLANQLMHTLGVGHASLAGQQAQSSHGGAGGGSAQADSVGYSLGVGF